MAKRQPAASTQTQLAGLEAEAAAAKQATTAPVETKPKPTLQVAMTDDGRLIVSFPWADEGTPSKALRERGKGIMKHVESQWQTVLLPNGTTISVNLMAGIKQG
tara:strand:+ start:60 stop:371 length:312 start_codon:yes stop_codon:yes gene_type:complete